MIHHEKSEKIGRSLSILDYLEVLIREYFVADTRRKIYPSKSDKLHWKKVARYKKDKILDITKRNQIPSIFDDEATRDKYYDRYFPADKVPLIIQTTEDLENYYSIGSDVVIIGTNPPIFAIIIGIDFRSEEIKVEMRENTEVSKTYKMSSIKRLL